jgi:hypothetical protein
VPRTDIGSDTPLRLSVAADAYPDGSMTASGLRREADKGRLVIERTAGKEGGRMDKRPRSPARTLPADLSVPERMLLFCVASSTEWERAGVTGATVTAMIVRGLIERDAGNRLTLTDRGHAAFAALIGE